MSGIFGISGGGRSAEELFRAYTGAQPAPRAAQGDAILEGAFVEVKKASSSTLNQVRAVKYIPLVVFYEPREEWYVVPAHAVVAAVSRKVRGQHTENPFESATMSVTSVADYRVSDVRDLREATLEAIASSEQYPELRQAMDHILRESRLLAEESLREVRGLLQQLEL